MKILHVNKSKADVKFLFYVIKAIIFPINERKRYWISNYSKIKIPLPPLEVQKEIIKELNNYQKIINQL